MGRKTRAQGDLHLLVHLLLHLLLLQHLPFHRSMKTSKLLEKCGDRYEPCTTTATKQEVNVLAALTLTVNAFTTCSRWAAISIANAGLLMVPRSLKRSTWTTMTTFPL